MGLSSILSGMSEAGAANAEIGKALSTITNARSKDNNFFLFILTHPFKFDCIKKERLILSSVRDGSISGGYPP